MDRHIMAAWEQALGISTMKPIQVSIQFLFETHVLATSEGPAHGPVNRLKKELDLR